MKVFIYGMNGNMGRRYAAILEHLGHEWTGEDLGVSRGAVDDTDAIIIATPTDTHAEVLRPLLGLGKPILCEKPVCKDMNELKQLMAMCVMAGTRLQMVSQYDYLVNPTACGKSFYHYFKSGPDGLAWDCLQIIANAKERPGLSNGSPVWSCQINGKRLSLSDMDFAYVSMIRDWLQAPRNDISRILDSHQKVIEWLEKS